MRPITQRLTLALIPLHRTLFPFSFRRRLLGSLARSYPSATIYGVIKFPLPTLADPADLSLRPS